MRGAFPLPLRSLLLGLWLFLPLCTGQLAVAAVPQSGAPVAKTEGEVLAGQLAASLDRRANPRTGLVQSFAGDTGVTARHGAQIYDTGLRLLVGSRYSPEIIRTFAAKVADAGKEDRPQTLATGFSPATGIFSWIRISGFDQPWWWNDWEWSVKTGENAWLGLGALHYYRQAKDRLALQVAVDRADFILLLQDGDGGIRIGPRGLADDFWWQRKSTENNQSALAFLDELSEITGEKRYRQAADRVYEWLATAMYDRKHHLFMRGAVETEGGWRKDTIDVFAADTVNWAPIERILADRRFGSDRRERLAEIERMIAAGLDLCGVRKGDELVGISYSPLSRKKSVISLEWSAQFALLCRRLAAEYRGLGDTDKAETWDRRYQEMLAHLVGYLNEQGGEKVAAHAVYPDGAVAVGEPMWDDIVRTPRAFLSAASHLYIGFALRGFDPLRRND